LKRGIFSEKLAPHETEVIKLLLEISVENDHLSEAHGKELQGVDSGHFGEHAMAESGLTDERNVLGAIAHVEAAEKILVFDRSGVAGAVALQVLQVGLDHGMQVTHLGHEHVLALHYVIQDIIERDGCRRDRLGALSGRAGWRGRRIHGWLCRRGRVLRKGCEDVTQQKKSHNGAQTDGQLNMPHKNLLKPDHANWK